MWNVFKFFFVWFWLGVGSVVVWMVLAAYTAPPVMVDPKTGMQMHGAAVGMLVGLVFGFLMCIPAYFIARPKRGSVRVVAWEESAEDAVQRDLRERGLGKSMLGS